MLDLLWKLIILNKSPLTDVKEEGKNITFFVKVDQI